MEGMSDIPHRSLQHPDATETAGQSQSFVLDAGVVRQLTNLLAGLRYGSVEIVVHDGAITQIERREKVRVPGVPLRRA